MPAFLSDITPFFGTGQRNEKGEDLQAFLDGYDARRYESPSVTTDILVFQSHKGIRNAGEGLKLLMIQRKNHPSIGFWALPGGFAGMREHLEDAAKRELYEETGLTGIDLAQLFCWGEPARDPRTRLITVSYLAMVEEELVPKAADDAADALWFDLLVNKKREYRNPMGQNEIYYSMRLHQKERDIRLSADLKKTVHLGNRLLNPSYQLLDADHIAFDHPCFILQAVDRINQVIGAKL